MLLGTAVDASVLETDADYRDLVGSRGQILTPENEMKFVRVHPEPDRYDFSPADRVVEFARGRGAKLRGHTLVWHSQLPDWVAETDPGERRDVLHEHIRTVAGRYRGSILHWDVVNEPLEDDGTPRHSPWFDALGIDYIADAFRWAHEADPSARLYLNDYNVEDLGAKSDAYYELVTRLLAEGVPIHGFGVQGHRILGDPPTTMRANLRRFAELGLEVALTEVDVRMPVPARAADLEEQAADYHRMLMDAAAEPGCTAFVLWGLGDRYSWVPDTFEGFGAATVLDEQLRPKPAFDAVFGAALGAADGAEEALV